MSRPHVARASGNQEWYTPVWILDGVRAVLGGIDLDPATCIEAQRTVQAKRFYTEAEDGLRHKWTGNVYLNPPYARGVVDRFAVKFVAHYLLGHIREGCVLVNNATETVWFQTLGVCVTAICAIQGRVSFGGPASEGNKGLQGQALLYYGAHAGIFKRVWEPHGQVYLAVGDGLRRRNDEVTKGIYYAMEEARSAMLQVADLAVRDIG